MAVHSDDRAATLASFALKSADRKIYPDIQIWNEDGQWHVSIPGEDMITYLHTSRMIDDLEEVPGGKRDLE